MSNDILSMLQDWFVERLGEPVSPDALYLKEEGLDSFDAIAFVAYVEQQFSIHLQAKDIQSAQFATLRGVAEVITTRQQGAG